jgi:hypothetical protein
LFATAEKAQAAANSLQADGTTALAGSTLSRREYWRDLFNM